MGATGSFLRENPLFSAIFRVFRAETSLLACPCADRVLFHSCRLLSGYRALDDRSPEKAGSNLAGLLRKDQKNETQSEPARALRKHIHEIIQITVPEQEPQ